MPLSQQILWLIVLLLTTGGIIILVGGGDTRIAKTIAIILSIAGLVLISLLLAKGL